MRPVPALAPVLVAVTLTQLVCQCFVNTKYQVQLDHSIPSEFLHNDRSQKYTNVTIGNDSFLCLFGRSSRFGDASEGGTPPYGDGAEEEALSGCDDLGVFKKAGEAPEGVINYVEEKLHRGNYLLKYSQGKGIYYELHTHGDPPSSGTWGWGAAPMVGSEVDAGAATRKRGGGEAVKGEDEEGRSTTGSSHPHRGANQALRKDLPGRRGAPKKHSFNETSAAQRMSNGRLAIQCNFQKVYDYIFYKHKFNAYHKNRTYRNVNDEVMLKNHMIKGKMLTIKNACIDAFTPSSENELKICLNRSISFATNRHNQKKNKNKKRKHSCVCSYLSDKDLLFVNNTVVQYYSDGTYFFEVLFLCGNNNLRVNSFEKLHRRYFPFIFQIYEHVQANLTQLHKIIRNRRAMEQPYFFKTFSPYRYSESYFRALKEKLNKMLNAFFPKVTHLYRVTLSAYMFCDYTDRVNPPNHFLLKGLMNKCFQFTKHDEYFYEVCLPNSVIRYEKDEYDRVKYPLTLLGSSDRSSNEGKPFFEKVYDAFPVLKMNYRLRKDAENYLKTQKGVITQSAVISITREEDIDHAAVFSGGDFPSQGYPPSANQLSASSILAPASATVLSSSSVFSASPSEYTQNGSGGGSSGGSASSASSGGSASGGSGDGRGQNVLPPLATFKATITPLSEVASPPPYFSFAADRIPYISTYMIDKPVEILKYGNENFYKALAIDLRGGRCRDSLGDVHDYITTIYFDCSLHYKNETQTNIVNIFQTTECHYYVHVSSPVLCAHPTLHTSVKSQNEVIRCFRNVFAASAQRVGRSRGRSGSGKSGSGKSGSSRSGSSRRGSDRPPPSCGERDDPYLSDADKLYLHQFQEKKKKMMQKKNMHALESVPRNTKMEFGVKYDFGLGNYIRKRVYKGTPIFHIGNIVRHRYWNYEAVVVSWDYICYAPAEWKYHFFLEYPTEVQNSVHYLLLVNKDGKKGGAILHDRSAYTDHPNKRAETSHARRAKHATADEKWENVRLNVSEEQPFHDDHFNFAYVPESSLVYGDKMIYSEHLSQFFEQYNSFFHFYIPKKDHIIWKLFPYDFFNLIF
ncbi:cloroquine resistance associated protein cg1 [Plasmodium vivax India VII]|uniref:Cloroquine resistance associated protein cg1 n=1 Tax=Plasmodium vivax India VII TaxID=1077284 RepID=A0A0J9SKH1_PLAVI|nr:cloroquine resistance associated protein cg1 [Plasmodium vivax India VII]